MMTLSPENHAAQQQQQQPGTTVELATLILPLHASDRGLDQEDQVILEAAHATVENLNDQARISAVVDLTALSELVGCSQQEFIADLRFEAASTTEPHLQNSTMIQEKVEPERRTEGDEEQPLLAGHYPSLVAPDRISLIADPFLVSLAEVLHVTTFPPEERRRQDEAIVFAESTLAADGDQNLCHDAFLLNLPNESIGGPLQDHFVLALPEIVEDAGHTGSTHTETSQEQHMPFLERAMSLLPTTTHLPTDVVDLHLEAHQEPALTENITAYEEKEEQHLTLHLDIVVERKVPVIGYVILISGLLALSSVGAALNLQKGPSPTMKTLWRQLATCLVLVPMVLKSIHQEGLPKLAMQQWYMLPLAAVAYAYMTLAFVFALDWTTMANAFVFSNMTSLVIIVGRVLLRLPVLPAEGFGAAVGFSGAAVCAQDDAANYESMEHDNFIMVGSSMSGNLIALSASFGTACYLIVAKDLRPRMDLFVFVFCVMLLSSCFMLVSIIVAGEEFSLGMDPIHGIWGWLNPMPDRLPLELYMALVCNCLGTTGYIAVMKYFEPIVPATVMLMEPVVGSLLGVATGTASLPGLQTWIGNVIVGFGTFIVIYSGSSKTEKIDATEAIRQSLNGSSVSSVMKSPLIRKNPAK